MNIPAPVSFGPCPTITLGAPLGWLEATILDLAGPRVPIILHQLGSAKERQDTGPRELRDQTLATLDSLGFSSPWGFGGVCQDGEEAGLFATAGATWFTFELASKLEPLAEGMSLDALDAAIVALEDEGCFPLCWHEGYLDPARTFHGAPGLVFADDVLARIAVKFGRALAHAEQVFHVCRAASGGGLPDVEYRFDGGGDATTPEEFIFLCAELTRRGLLSGAGTRIRPSFGPWYEPGGVDDEDFSPPAGLVQLPTLCPPAITLSAPLRFARAMGWEAAHWDATDECRLAYCVHLARSNPPAFRQWLTAAHLAFPVARGGKHLSTTEDDVHFLPIVEDDQLVATFLDTKQGRQLLLASWDEIAATFQKGA